MNPRAAPKTHGRAASKGDDPLEPPRRAKDTRARGEQGGMTPFDAPVYAAIMSLAVPSLHGVHGLTRTQRSALAFGVCLLLALGAASSGALAVRSRPATPELHAEGLAVGPGGLVVEVGPDTALVPGSRVLAGMPDSLALAQQQADWLAAGTVPQVDRSGRRPGPRGPA